MTHHKPIFSLGDETSIIVKHNDVVEQLDRLHSLQGFVQHLHNLTLAIVSDDLPEDVIQSLAYFMNSGIETNGKPALEQAVDYAEGQYDKTRDGREQAQAEIDRWNREEALKHSRAHGGHCA